MAVLAKRSRFEVESEVMRRWALGIVAWSLAVTACGGTTQVTLGGDRQSLACSDTAEGRTAKTSDAMPMMLFSAEGRVLSLAADATHLYWIELVEGELERLHRVMRVALATGVREALAAGAESPTMHLVLDETHVYWSKPAHDDVPGQLGSVAKNGGLIQILYESRDFSNESPLAADEDSLYFNVQNVVYRIGKHSTLETPRRLFAADARGLAVSGGTLYFSDFSAGFVASVGTDDTQELNVIEYVDRPLYLALSCGRVVFSSDSPAPKLHLADPDSNATQELGETTSLPFPVDSRFAYTGSEGALYRIALSDGTRKQLSSDSTAAEKLVAVNDTHVFWTSSESGGAIYALKK
jgi:hypothetical protein